MDEAIYAVGVFSPIMTVPQLIKIWFDRNASGISVVSWSAYLFESLFWLAYGILHAEHPIIFTSVVWIVLEILIIIGTVIFG